MPLLLSAPAVGWLANEGYDPLYGARPLKRVIQRELQNTIASLILEGAVPDGSALDVTVDAGGLAVRPAEAAKIPEAA